MGTGGGEPEEVGEKGKNVLVLLVTKIVGNGKRGRGAPGAGAGRLMNRRENKSSLDENRRFFHFVPQVITFAGSLADPGKD